MKAEYDFSQAERGQFYRPDSTFNSPIYLDDDVQVFVRERAAERGIDPNDVVVNEILRKEIACVSASVMDHPIKRTPSRT